MTIMTKLSDLTGDYVLDTAHTRIGFVARHTMGTKVRGQLDNFEGSARLDGEHPSESSAELTSQAKSIQTGNRRRDALLRSKFLDIDNHATITFTSTGVEQVGEITFKVSGDLTIRGVTKPVNLDLRVTGAENDRWDNLRVRIAGSTTINRKDWGVRWNAAAGLVSKTLTLEFDVVAIRQS